MSVRTRLLLLFFLITTGAVAFVYLYVVPQLNSSLTTEKLRRLEQVGKSQSDRIAAAIRGSDSQAHLRRVIRAAAQQTDARVTVLGVRNGESGPQPDFVLGDSEFERTAIVPTYPATCAG